MSSFDKVVGYEDIKRELQMFSDVIKNFEKYEKLGVKLPRGILLDGEPGVGKTLLAKCFIEESGCKHFILRKDKPDGDFINEIRNTFSEAKKESCAIVFLDDMDKFANEDSEHKDAEEYVTVQACIDECKDTGVFVIATVNDRFCMPDSLVRAGRFDKVIEVSIPKGDESKNIIKYYLSQKKTMENLDVEEIAQILEGTSCAQIESVINEAGIYACYENKDSIEREDIIRACMRLIFDAPQSSKESEYIYNYAVHEAGHAVVAEVLSPGSVSLVSVCKHTGATEGVVVTHQAEDYCVNKKTQENDIMRHLGGKAATEAVLGGLDLGSKSDIRQAYDIVYNFVEDLCAYGFDKLLRYEPSQTLLTKKDIVIAEEMEKYYKKAQKLILDNRDFHAALTKELVDKKTLTQKDIVRIKQSLKIAV